jgi:hypothetical protein
MGLFSTKKSTSTSTTVSMASDLRQGVEGMTGGAVVGPKATLGASGSVTTAVGDYSAMTQNVVGNTFKTGMSGAEVKALLGEQGSLFGQQLGKVTDFGSAAFSAVQAGRSQELAAVTGELPNWQKYLPLLIVGGIAFAAVHRKRKG